MASEKKDDAPAVKPDVRDEKIRNFLAIVHQLSHADARFYDWVVADAVISGAIRKMHRPAGLEESKEFDKWIDETLWPEIASHCVGIRYDMRLQLAHYDDKLREAFRQLMRELLPKASTFEIPWALDDFIWVVNQTCDTACEALWNSHKSDQFIVGEIIAYTAACKPDPTRDQKERLRSELWPKIVDAVVGFNYEKLKDQLPDDYLRELEDELLTAVSKLCPNCFPEVPEQQHKVFTLMQSP